MVCFIVLGMLSLEESLASPVQESEPQKPTKREGNDGDLPTNQAMPTHAKTSRRTTSLLNLFMSNSQGMWNLQTQSVVRACNGCLGLCLQGQGRAEPCPAAHHPVPRVPTTVRATEDPSVKHFIQFSFFFGAWSLSPSQEGARWWWWRLHAITLRAFRAVPSLCFFCTSSMAVLASLLFYLLTSSFYTFYVICSPSLCSPFSIHSISPKSSLSRLFWPECLPSYLENVSRVFEEQEGQGEQEEAKKESRHSEQ